MADGKELKPKSFRIDDETYQKFREISDRIGGSDGKASQQQPLQLLINKIKHLLSCFEFLANLIIPEADAFFYVNRAFSALNISVFMGVSSSNSYGKIELLISKDATIQDLQEKLAVAKQLKEDATLKAKTYADENARLNGVIDSLNNEYNSKMDDMQSMLSDKDNLNKSLTDSCNDLRSKVESMKEAAEQSAILRGELDQLKKEQKKIFQEQSELEKQMQKLKVDKQAEVDKYQQKYFDLLEQMKSQTATVE